MKTARKDTTIHLSASDRIYDTVVNLIVGVFMLLVLLPLINIVSSSFSSPSAVSNGKVALLPVELSLEATRPCSRTS